MSLFKKGASANEMQPVPDMPRAAGPETAPARSHVLPAPSASHLGKSVKIVGTIAGEEDLSLDCRIEGNVSASCAVLIGANGIIQGEVAGDSVTVLGHVIGNITAKQKVILKPSAKVEGNICCASFVVNEGASFEGNIQMRAPAQDA